MTDELDPSKTLDSANKHLAESLFRVNRDISPQKIVSKMGQYLNEKSPSFLKGELNKLIEAKYCNNCTIHRIPCLLELSYLPKRLAHY